jgi:serine protease
MVVPGLATVAALGLQAGGGHTASAAALSGASTSPTVAAHQPAVMYNIPNTAAINGNTTVIKPAIQPPPVLACLPVAPPSPIPGCVPPAPPAGEPWPGNMAYFGGHVQVTPKIYLIFYGWGDKGAFSTCATRPKNDPVPCDPDGAGLRMQNFVKQLGGTAWAGSQTQYYEVNTDSAGHTFQTYIQNPVNQLKGVWYDNTSPIDPKMTYTEIAQEAARGVQHFGVKDLLNSQFIVAQPKNFSDPAAQSAGYCAWHDYTEPGIENGIYNGITPYISFTNMPYILNQGTSCGQNSVNAGAAGTLDGESIVLGHEIEETVTDPGAEDPGPNGASLGAWYDMNQYENGDKCAWVGADPVWLLTGSGPEPVPNVPGSIGTITGDLNGKPGQTFPVQALWSNNAAGGAGYCAGAGTDLPSVP